MESRDSTWTLDVHVLQAAARPDSLCLAIGLKWEGCHHRSLCNAEPLLQWSSWGWTAWTEITPNPTPPWPPAPTGGHQRGLRPGQGRQEPTLPAVASADGGREQRSAQGDGPQEELGRGQLRGTRGQGGGPAGGTGGAAPHGDGDPVSGRPPLLSGRALKRRTQMGRYGDRVVLERRILCSSVEPLVTGSEAHGPRPVTSLR